MRHLELTVRPDPAVAPPAFRLFADSPHMAEARLVEWNPAGSAAITLFYVCDGDADAVAAALESAAVVADHRVEPIDDGRFGLVVRVDRGGSALVDRVFAAVTTSGLIVRKPVVYRDGAVHARFVGTEATLRETVSRIPDPVDVTVERLGAFEGDPRSGTWGLTARQREAVRAALDLGYYEQPRQATHADVAAAIDCAPSTASEHLRKAEARLARAALGTGR